MRLTRIEAGKYTAYDGRYTVIREPYEALEAGAPAFWLAYDEVYGGQGAGICLERMERLYELRPELESYHADVIALEAERDDADAADHKRVLALVRLHAVVSREQVAEEFGWPLRRAIDALEKSTARNTQGIFKS